jgi:hypothetical protein
VRLVRPVQITYQAISIATIGSHAANIAGRQVIEDVEILEEEHDVINLGEAFNAVFDDTFLGGLYPYENQFYTDYNTVTHRKTWMCKVESIERVTPGTSVFSVEKTRMLREIERKKKQAAEAIGAIEAIATFRRNAPFSRTNAIPIKGLHPFP